MLDLTRFMDMQATQGLAVVANRIGEIRLKTDASGGGVRRWLEDLLPKVFEYLNRYHPGMLIYHAHASRAGGWYQVTEHQSENGFSAACIIQRVGEKRSYDREFLVFGEFVFGRLLNMLADMGLSLSVTDTRVPVDAKVKTSWAMPSMERLSIEEGEPARPDLLDVPQAGPSGSRSSGSSRRSSTTTLKRRSGSPEDKNEGDLPTVTVRRPKRARTGEFEFCKWLTTSLMSFLYVEQLLRLKRHPLPPLSRLKWRSMKLISTEMVGLKIPSPSRTRSRSFKRKPQSISNLPLLLASSFLPLPFAISKVATNSTPTLNFCVVPSS